MTRRLALPIALLLAAPLSATGSMEVFHQWRTPEGSIYIGETPPEGSTLVKRVELPSSAASAMVDRTGDALARAAEDGRDLIRRREAAREAARDRELARDVRERELRETELDTVIVTGSLGWPHRRRHRGHDHDDHHHRRDREHRRDRGPIVAPSPLAPIVRSGASVRMPSPPRLRPIPRVAPRVQRLDRGPWARR